MQILKNLRKNIIKFRKFFSKFKIILTKILLLNLVYLIQIFYKKKQYSKIKYIFFSFFLYPLHYINYFLIFI